MADSPDRPVSDAEINQARWQAVLNTARDGIVSIDRASLIRLFNPSAERIFGYAAKEVLGEHVGLLMPEPYRSRHDAYIREYEQTGTPKAIGRIRSVEGRRKSGEVFPLELAVSVAWVGGEPLYTAIVRDVSELRALQRAAEQRDRLADVGAVAAQIVHDVGNPLAAISLQAQLALRRARRQAQRSDALDAVVAPLEQILSEVDRLKSLTQEFMSFAGEQRLHPVCIDLREFIATAVGAFQPIASSLAIDLEFDVPIPVPQLYADPHKLRRVLDNLIGNAIDAVERGPGRVAVRVDTPRSGRVRISVHDTGPGVAPDIDPLRLFETTKPQGTGLGLPVANEIVLAHGGVLEWSAGEPSGTVFRVELPVRPPSHG